MPEMTPTYHVPIMRDACMQGLNIKPDGVYVDVTFGGGGHSRAILDQLSEQGRLFAFDQDPDAAANVPEDARFTLIPENFRFIRNFLRMHGVRQVDGVLADLGVSSHQFDEGTRGFSIRMDGPLDMRMNPRTGFSAAEWLAKVSLEELMSTLRLYGEVQRPDKCAHVIAKAREAGELKTTGELMAAIRHLAPRGKENKYNAQVFQALRIVVNDELAALREMLLATTSLLPAGGRLVVMSFHSLEDRLVKHFMRSGNFEDEARRDFKGALLAPFAPINRKAIVADAEELQRNPRSRSARLRVAERTETPLNA